MRRAVSFLTPFGGPADPAPSALAWFPAVGALNQAVAAVADEVLFVVAGRILPLGPPGAR